MVPRIQDYVRSARFDSETDEISGKAIRNIHGMAIAISILIWSARKQNGYIEDHLRGFKKLVSKTDPNSVPTNRAECLATNFLKIKYSFVTDLPASRSQTNVASAVQAHRTAIQQALDLCESYEVALRYVAVPRVLRMICCMAETGFDAMNAAAHPYMLIYDEDYVRHRLDFCQDEAMKYMLASNMFQHYGIFDRSQFWDLASVSSFHVSCAKSFRLT